MYVITDQTPMVSGKMTVATSSTIIANHKAEFPKCDLEMVLPTEAETPWTKGTIRAAIMELADEMVWDALWVVHQNPPEVKSVTLKLEINAMGVQINALAGASVTELQTPTGLRMAIKRVSMSMVNPLAQQIDYKFSELKE